MELLLKQNVEHLGRVGDVVKVRPGYARNYLLPNGMAVMVTQANMAEIERALFDHELIKIRFRGMGRELREQEIARATRELDAELVGSVGGTAVLYRENPERKRTRSTS